MAGGRKPGQLWKAEDELPAAVLASLQGFELFVSHKQSGLALREQTTQVRSPPPRTCQQTP